MLDAAEASHPTGDVAAGEVGDEQDEPDHDGAHDSDRADVVRCRISGIIRRSAGACPDRSPDGGDERGQEDGGSHRGQPPGERRAELEPAELRLLALVDVVAQARRSAGGAATGRRFLGDRLSGGARLARLALGRGVVFVAAHADDGKWRAEIC
ncbi:hypothetical protein [Microbacterium aurum]